MVDGRVARFDLGGKFRRLLRAGGVILEFSKEFEGRGAKELDFDELEKKPQRWKERYEIENPEEDVELPGGKW